MSQGQAPVIDPTERETAEDNYESWLRGGTGTRMASEGFSSLAFPELKAKAKAAAAELKGDPFSIPAATKASFFAAVYRDMRYAHASRGKMLALGAHNALRELHEGVRIAKDTGQ